MANKTINALVKRGLEIKLETERLANELAGINAKLIAAGEGEKYSNDLGSVTVTTQTEGRPSGKYDIRFDREVFDSLAHDDQLRVLALSTGMVTLEQGYISGRAPVVQYRLN